VGKKRLRSGLREKRRLESIFGDKVYKKGEEGALASGSVVKTSLLEPHLEKKKKEKQSLETF